MRKAARIISLLSLAGIITPTFLYLAGAVELPAVKDWMLVFSLTWFATVPLWMDRRTGD